MTSGVPRKTVLAIKGLVTTPNEFGVYPEGSCSVCENVLQRSANQWTVARDTQSIFSWNSVTNVFERVIGTAPGTVFGIVSGWYIVQNNGTGFNYFDVDGPVSTVGPGTSITNLFDANGYITPLITRNRVYLNTTAGVIVCDKLAPASAGERVFRCAGLPQPTHYTQSAMTGEAVPSLVTVTYSMVIRRTTPDGYVLVSPPSIPLRFINNTPNPLDVLNGVRWTYTTDYQVGDVLELYRSAGIASTSPDVDTGTSMRLVAQRALDAADIAATLATIWDRQPMTAPLYETSGQEIYTSPYQDGSTGANLVPPICKTMAQWGNYTFYGNVTDDPSWIFDVPAGVMDTATGGSSATAWVRQYGIGRRELTGTRTSGSPVVTAVSAADMVGITVGQVWGSGTGFNNGNAGHKVIAVGATSFTMNANSTVTATGLVSTVDVVEINGAIRGVYSFVGYAWGAGTYLNNNMAVFPSESIAFTNPVPYVVGNTLLLRPKRGGSATSFSIKATNGGNYAPPLPASSSTAQVFSQTERPNVLRWSRPNQPEAVPSPNEAFIGSGAIIRLLATTDCLWVLCTDGAYRLSGAAGVWRADLVDPTFIPIAPDACCVLNDVLYAYTPRGIASLSGTQTSLLTRGVIDAEFPVLQFSADKRIHLYADQTNEELIVLRQNTGSLAGASTVYVYSILYNQWSTYAPSTSALTAVGTFLPTNGVSPPYPMFGFTTGTAASVLSWRADSGTPIDPAKIYLQPLYAADSLVNKRWIDATWLGGPVPGVVTLIDQYVDSLSTPSGQSYLAGTGAGESRGSIGIARARAIAPTLRLFAQIRTFSSSPPAVIKGVSVRFVPLTTQQKNAT